MAHGGDPLAFDDEVDDVRGLIVVITHHRHPIDELVADEIGDSSLRARDRIYRSLGLDWSCSF